MFKKVVLNLLGCFCVAFAMVVYNTNILDIMTQTSGSYISDEV